MLRQLRIFLLKTVLFLRAIEIALAILKGKQKRKAKITGKRVELPEFSEILGKSKTIVTGMPVEIKKTPSPAKEKEDEIIDYETEAIPLVEEKVLTVSDFENMEKHLNKEEPLSQEDYKKIAGTDIEAELRRSKIAECLFRVEKQLEGTETGSSDQLSDLSEYL